MAGQVEFMEAIHELERIAETNGKQLTMEEIRNYFQEMNLDETQFDFICKYYESHQIVISNRVEKQETILDEEISTREDPLDAEMVEIYVKEAELAEKLTQEQMEEAIRELLVGDDQARQLLVEANLSKAIAIAREYQGKGLLLSDLIQESNMGLMMAVAEYQAEGGEDFFAYIEGRMRQQIGESLADYNETTRSAMKMANRVNELNDIATAFAKEFDREAKPEELAGRMGISEEEVRDLMKVSLDAINIMDDNEMGE